MWSVRALAVAALSVLAACDVALGGRGPKQGGIFRIYHRDSPGSASIHEGATYSINIPVHARLQQPGHLSTRTSRRTA